MDDVADSKLWGRYMEAYEDAIRNTATAHAPWYVVPGDYKWFAWLMVAAAVADAMERLDLRFPVVKGKALAELEKSTQGVGKGLITGTLATRAYTHTNTTPWLSELARTTCRASRCSFRSPSPPTIGLLP
jgi:Polyphosphate kinase 2 (PPK2)